MTDFKINRPKARERERVRPAPDGAAAEAPAPVRLTLAVDELRDAVRRRLAAGLAARFDLCRLDGEQLAALAAMPAADVDDVFAVLGRKVDAGELTEAERDAFGIDPSALPRPCKAAPRITPAPEDPHAALVEAARAGLLATRDAAIAQGAPGLALFGAVLDLEDPLVPAAFRDAPAARDAVRRARGRHAAIQVLVEERGRLLALLLPLAHRLAGTEPPLLISASYADPPFLRPRRAHNDPTEMPVVVVAGRRASIKALPVGAVVKPTLLA